MTATGEKPPDKSPGWKVRLGFRPGAFHLEPDMTGTKWEHLTLYNWKDKN